MTGHAHAEAFMLMDYRCKGCGAEEVIWNSRDGVTPFGVDCRSCGGEATHVRWAGGRYAPRHMPAVGSRMFVDLTPERARQAAARNAALFWDTYPPSRDRFATVELLADMLAASYLEQPGSPDLIVVAG